MKRQVRTPHVILEVVVSLLILLCAQAVFAQPEDWSIVTSGGELENGTHYKQGEIVVRFMNGTGQQLSGPRTTRAVRSTISDSIINGCYVDKEYDQLVPGLTLVMIPEGVSVLDAVIRFNRSSDIFYAQPNYKMKLAVIPNDPRFFEQWALDNVGQTLGLPDADIDAPEAWDILNATDIIVAVADSGIDYNHPDLIDNMWINDGEVNEPGIFDPNDINDVDDDGNGYNDDIFGYDFVNDDGDPMDDHFHGTHVAGIIGAVGNNEEGIAGVCWSVKLMALKVGDVNGVVYTDAAIEAIRYAVNKGASIINASYGGYGYSQAEYDAIAAAGDAEVIFVASAGNDAFPFASFPAGYDLDNIISVMATDHFDNMAVFSNYGLEDVDLGAPGVAILSTTPTEETESMSDNGIPTDYAFSSGTSMAAPHVSGACALLKTLNPALIPIQVKLILMRAVDRTLPDLCVSEGRLNLFNALHMARLGVVLNTRTDVRYGSIQEAINAAIDGDELIADANYWYIESIDFLGKKITVSSGDVNAPPDYGVVSPSNTFISALFEVGIVVNFDDGEGAGTLLSGFTITDGDEGIHVENSSPRVTDCVVTRNADRGIYCFNSSPELSDCTITESTTEESGAGIFCDGNSDPNIINCIITSNSAEQNGGGIYCANDSEPNISNCTIADNTSGANGGGIYCGQDSSLNITGSTISGNAAQWPGGGIYCVTSSPQISDCTITDNTTGWDGGGIYCDIGSEPSLRNCTISNNIADYDGGGIYCNGTSTLVKNCLIINNTVDSWDGGGIFCANASPVITNCTFVGNSGNDFDGLGGAVYCAEDSKPVITNCIFNGNNDIAIYEQDQDSDPAVAFCLFYKNSRGDYYDKDSDKVYSADSTSFNNVVSGGNSFSGNPMFVPGRLGNFYLSQYEAGQVLDANGQIVDPNLNPEDATSPAVDAGSADAESLGMHLYSTRTDNLADQNGHKDSGRVDIGYHYNDPNPPQMYILFTGVVPVGKGSISPDQAGSPYAYFQYSQVPLVASPNDPNVYQFKSWNGTDYDTRIDMTSTGDIAVVQKNIVTMDSHKTVTVAFETILVTLRTRVVGGNGTVNPRGGQYPRGTVVELTAIPVDPANRIIWNGSDDDFLTLRTNTVTMSVPFMIDPQGREYKEVEVTFYAPRTLDVPGDYTSIQFAIDDANDGDIIVVAPSDEPYLTVQGHSIYKTITITSANPDDPNVVARTIVEAQPAGPDGGNGVGFYFYEVGPDAVLNGLTIRGFNLVGFNGQNGNPNQGYYDGVPGTSVYGSAILCYLASPTIKNCVITDCSADGGNGGNGANGDDDHPAGGHGGWPGGGYGGGLACLEGSNPDVINCTFDNCTATGGDGGDGGDGDDEPLGPGGRGGGWYYPFLPFPDYEFGPFEFYTEYSGHGGAAYCDAISSPTFVNCTFTNNRTESGTCGISGITPTNFRYEPTIRWLIDNSGGAVYIAPYPEYFFDFGFFIEEKSEAEFENCTFSNNVADPNIQLDSEGFYVSYGGAVAFAEDAMPNFNNCTFNNNLATVGGAMYWEWAEPLVSDCNFVANTGFHGGGAYFVGGSGEIIRSNFRENDAIGIAGAGGAIHCFDANALIADCSIVNNDANGSGGGIYFGGSDVVQLKNCLIVENSAGRDGGGISADWNSESKITNCTIAGNLVTGEGFDTGYGGGLYCSYESYATVIDSIFWDNSADPLDANDTGDQIAVGTGFEFDQRPATLDISYSNVEGWQDPNGAKTIDPGAVFVDTGSFLNWDFSSNIDEDPLFVSGYFLSHNATGHDRNSPCIDAGSASVNDPNVLMHKHTTRVDSFSDVDIVDMGFHYVIDLLDLTVAVVGGNGTVEPSGTTTYNRNAIVTVKAMPDSSYRVKGWFDVNDVLVSIDRELEVVMDSDKTFTVEFELRGTTVVSGGGDAIQQSIDNARGGETLVVAADTYNGNINLLGKDITLVSTNPDDPNVVAMTIIDCQQSGRGFIFNSGEDSDTVVNGFTIINGSFTGEGGAGIYIDPNSSPTIRNVTISNCDVTGANGGGIFVDVNSSPTFINCTIIDCSADGGGGAFCDFNSAPIFEHCSFGDNSANLGGGIYYDANCTSTMIDCTFSSNSAIEDGGGLLCDPNSSIMIADCNFAGNLANRGAALFGMVDSLVTVDNTVFIENVAANEGGAMYWVGADMVITDSNIVSNSALRGGGLYCDVSPATNITRCIIQDNLAGVDGLSTSVVGQGGGIYCFATLGRIRDSVITRNVANTSGGGLYIAGDPNSPQVINCLITDNVAGRDGGGISVSWRAEPIIANCTLVKNTAAGSFGDPNNSGFGGGLYCSYESNCEVRDSIFWNNFALDGYEMAVGTGFEFDPRCATLTVLFSDVQEGQGSVRVDDGCTFNWSVGNIDQDPFFVTGPLDEYYLSLNSPAVNAGSDFAFKAGLFAFTTRTDGMPDTGIVDMGYHRQTVEPCRFCDLIFDGIISFPDFAVFMSRWLDVGCHEGNAWCGGADFTFDTHVGFEDLAFLTDCWLVEDTNAPIPNPSEWEIEPFVSSSSSIIMTAKTAFDTWGWPVQYYFQCVYGNCHDSGWQDSPTYRDGGLTAGKYAYRVKARDTSPNLNETDFSTIASAGEQDITPPAPAPDWETEPNAISTTEILMVTTTVFDDSGVEYYFEAITAGGHDSSWQNEPNYTDTGLDPNTEYCYRVKARDKSPNQNETVWSPIACATTLVPIETNPPTPNPMQFDPNGVPTEIFGGGGTFDYYATMTAVVATDASGAVEYFFECVDEAGFSSGWQAANTYTVLVGRQGQGLRFRVRARDQYGNETAWSEVMAALPANQQ